MPPVIKVNAWINFPENNKNKPLENILKRMNPDYPLGFKSSTAGIYWPAKTFGFDRVRAFREAPPEVQQEMLRYASMNTFVGSIGIERAGITLAAAMSLMANTIEERLLFSQFAAQEANHYQAIAKYLPMEPKDNLDYHFFERLKNIVETGEANALSLVLQIFLEGWGIRHYKKMGNECLDRGLQQTFQNIVADEAHHHGAGVTLFDEKKLSDDERRFCLRHLKEIMRELVDGQDHYILQAALAPDQPHTIFYAETNFEEEAQKKLQQMKKILQAGGAHSLVEELDGEKFFDSLNLLQGVA